MLLTSEVVGKIFFKDMIVVIQYLAEQAQDFKVDAANDYTVRTKEFELKRLRELKRACEEKMFRHECKAANYEHAGSTTIFSKYSHALFCEYRWNQLLQLQ